jgi:hypothetical protein
VHLAVDNPDHQGESTEVPAASFSRPGGARLGHQKDGLPIRCGSSFHRSKAIDARLRGQAYGWGLIVHCSVRRLAMQKFDGAFPQTHLIALSVLCKHDDASASDRGGRLGPTGAERSHKPRP